MRYLFILILFILSGCDVGSTTIPTPHYGWYDALGSMVSNTPDTMYEDEDGYQWLIDVHTGQPYVNEGSIYYTDYDCQGDPYVYVATPRMPQRVTSGWYVRPDDLDVDVVPCWSVLTLDGECLEGTGNMYYLVSLNDCYYLGDDFNPPVLPWIGPLHREMNY